MSTSDNHSGIPAGANYAPIVRSLVWDIVVNAAVPLALYYFSKAFISPSEMTALIVATIFPVAKSVYDLVRRHEIDPVAVLVFLGIVTSIAAIFFGGDPRILLIRESFFTGAFGIICFVSLLFPRPIMFYFGRYFLAGSDQEKRVAFDARWQIPLVRRANRLVTVVWGLVYVGEFVVRVVLVYNLPAPIVLAVSPLLIGAATIFAIVWTFRYSRSIRGRIMQ